MKLVYKASNIRKAEHELGMKFFTAINSLITGFGVEDLYFLWAAGGATEEQFDEEFGKGMEGLLSPIVEAINDAGFLGEKIDITEFKKAMKNPTNLQPEAS